MVEGCVYCKHCKFKCKVNLNQDAKSVQGSKSALLACSLTTLDKIAELLIDVISMHQDADSADYNECDLDECAWCTDAKQVLREIGR